MTKAHRNIAARLGVAISFTVALMCTLGSGLWLCFAFLVAGVPIFKVEVCMLFFQFGALSAFFWKPWLIVAVSWVDLALILVGAIPWDERGGSHVIHQFLLDGVFFVTAHLGLIFSIMLKQSQPKTAIAPA